MMMIIIMMMMMIVSYDLLSCHTYTCTVTCSMYT